MGRFTKLGGSAHARASRARGAPLLLFIDIPSFIQTSFIIQISYHVSSSYCQQTFAHFTIKLWLVPDENQHQMLIYMPTGLPTKRSLL